MRTLIFFYFLIITTVVAQAQGTINFVNADAGSGMNAPIFMYDGATKLSGSAWTAELLAGPTLNRMQLVAQTGFFSGAGAGYFNGGWYAVDNVAAGASAWCVVQVWRTVFGSFRAACDSALLDSCGASAPFQVVLGGEGTPPSPPARLSGLTSFNADPWTILEAPPPRLVLRPYRTNMISITWDFSPGMSASWRYTVQQTHDLAKPNWTTVTNDFEVDQNLLRVTVPLARSNTFYRLVR